MTALIQRPLSWLLKALELQAGKSPQTLAGEVAPVVDVVQGGLAFANWKLHRFSNITGIDEQIQTLPVDASVIRLIQYSIWNSGGTSIIVEIALKDPLNGIPMNLFYESLPSFQFRGWPDVGRGIQWLILPPGYELRVGMVNKLQPDTCYVSVLVASVPVGTKPW